MKHIYTLTLLAGALSLAACTNDDAPQVEAETPAQFLTNLEQRVQTRMADDQWAAADAIGIFTLNDEQEGELLPDGTAAPSNLRMNMKYTRTAGNDAWESADPFYFKDPFAKVVYFMAYYPWVDDSQITGMGVGEYMDAQGTIAVDASDQANQPAFDYLYADKESDQPDAALPHGDKNQPTVKFHFRHSMTKVVVKLQPDPEGTTDYDEVAALTPTLKSFISQGTFSLADGVVTPAAFDAEGAVKDLVLSNKTEEAGTSVSFSAILPPQTTQDNTAQKAPEVTLSDGTDNYRSDKILVGKSLEAGKCYTVTITVKKMSLVVESTDITDWTPEDGGSSDAILQ